MSTQTIVSSSVPSPADNADSYPAINAPTAPETPVSGTNFNNAHYNPANVLEMWPLNYLAEAERATPGLSERLSKRSFALRKELHGETLIAPQPPVQVKQKPSAAVVQQPSPPPSDDAFMTPEEWANWEPPLGAENDVIFGSVENPLIERGTKNLVVANEKAYKTTFLKRLLAGLASGQTVYQALPVLRPMKVMYVHAEMTKGQIKRSVMGATQGLSHPNLLAGRLSSAHLIDKAGQKALRDKVQKLKPEVLVLDPWQELTGGGDDEENSNRDMGKATKFVNDLINDFGLTVFIVMHTGKDKSKGARGASRLKGWRDAELKVNRKNERTPYVDVEVYPRQAAAVEKFRLKFDKGTMWPTSGDDDKRDGGLSEATEKLAQLIKDHGGKMSRKDAAEQLGIDGKAFNKRLSRAKKDGAPIRADRKEVMLVTA